MYKITKIEIFKLKNKEWTKISNQNNDNSVNFSQIPNKFKLILLGGSHPPKKNNTFKALMTNILEYSPKEKSAKFIAEYSTL